MRFYEIGCNALETETKPFPEFFHMFSTCMRYILLYMFYENVIFQYEEENMIWFHAMTGKSPENALRKQYFHGMG